MFSEFSVMLHCTIAPKGLLSDPNEEWQMQYRFFLMMTLAMMLPSVAVQAAEVASAWSAKGLSMSSGRAWMDGPSYSFHRSGGSFAVAPAPALSMSAGVNGNRGIADVVGVADYLGSTSMFADIQLLAAPASAGPSLSAPSRVPRSREAATEEGISSNPGLSTDSKGLMTLLAGIGVIGFLTFKRGVAQSRY